MYAGLPGSCCPTSSRPLHTGDSSDIAETIPPPWPPDEPPVAASSAARACWNCCCSRSGSVLAMSAPAMWSTQRTRQSEDGADESECASFGNIYSDHAGRAEGAVALEICVAVALREALQPLEHAELEGGALRLLLVQVLHHLRQYLRPPQTNNAR